MDIHTTNSDNLPTLVEYIRLPDEIITGRYDSLGNLRTAKSADRSRRKNLYITVRDTSFIWGVFSYELQPGQRGEMIFTNVPGTFLVGASFNEWDPAKQEPCVEETLFTLISAERGPGVARIIGRNCGQRSLPTAAGIVVADDASYRLS